MFEMLLVFYGERERERERKTDLHFNSVYKLAKINAAVSYIWRDFVLFLKSKKKGEIEK